LLGVQNTCFLISFDGIIEKQVQFKDEILNIFTVK